MHFSLKSGGLFPGFRSEGIDPPIPPASDAYAIVIYTHRFSS